MRFLRDGPSIPDELLTARDEGRVVFFCGAGVSRARAGLPDFFELAQQVLAALEGAGDSPSKRLIQAARDVETKTRVSGLVSADRVFSFLERDFESRDIQAAVAKALIPSAAVDLSAHQILLDLARGPDGRTRLVTTNFELLFEGCDRKLTSWMPTRLPDPQRYEELDGIVHLHGRVNNAYSGAEGDGFVLSSAEFGHAYISHGWATRFISSILKKYLVVFVGYTADDPPVQYLLEGLNREPGSNSSLYAFQAGSYTEAEARWLHKGVQPIAYDDRKEHKALWDSLEAWAARARDVDGWYESVIAAAQKGPAALAPHERGQVKHVVSTLDGARRFSAADKRPPAEWLCVFDRASRFAPPGRVYTETDEEIIVDPFDAYGLDSDPVPARGQPDDPVPTRDVPEGAWDCLNLTRLDRESLPPGYLATFTGSVAVVPAPLAPRLAAIGRWLGKVSEQPAAVWWAAGRNGLHPDVQSHIRLHLEREAAPSSPAVRKAWRYLFEAWETAKESTRRDWYDLRASIRIDGWSPAAIWQFAALHEPHVTVARPSHSPRPPASVDGLQLHNLVRLGVEYPHMDRSPPIPDDHVRATVRAWRTALERAVLLQRDINAYALDRFGPLAADAQDGGRQRPFGLSIPVLYYLNLLKRLVAIDPGAAREEFWAWWKDDNTVFARLRIWSCGQEQLFSADETGQLLNELDQRAFWARGHQRDLLLVLAARWSSFMPEARKRLSDRLLAGPDRFEGEDDSTFAERRAWATLERIHWLRLQGCDLGFDVDQETARLYAAAPRWRLEYADKAAKSIAPRVRWVRRDSTFDELLSIPLHKLLTRVEELTAQRERHWVEKDPFAGLVKARPVRALSALTLAHKANTHPIWAWTTFLNSEARGRQGKEEKDDGDKRHIRFLMLISARLSQLPIEILGELAHPIADWLLTSSERHPPEIQRSEPLWRKLIAALRDTPTGEGGGDRAKEPDWATEALNSPAGKLAQVLMSDPSNADAEPVGGFDDGWLHRVEELLSLEGDAHRHALAIFSYNLNWFYARDPNWTERHLLAALEREEDVTAFWAGVLWAARIPSPPLYLRLKPALLRLERQSWIIHHNHLEMLAALILAGWGIVDDVAGTRLITDDEMRGVLLSASDDFRGQVLWQLEQWSEEADREWTARVHPFLIGAWPRQKMVKTAKASARLCELAFSNPEVFGAIADVVIGLVTPVERDHLMLYKFIETPEAIVDQYPEKVLALLSIVLPTDVSQWPYGIEGVLDRIGTAKPPLLTDGRLLELRRRWNAR